MKTFNRNPANIDTTGIKNYSKYFNQMNFKGILEDDNIYAIDQESFRDANNVYVNSDNKLVSRPTLQLDNLPSEIDVYRYELEDVQYIGKNTIYTNKSKTGSNAYYIVLVDENRNTHILADLDNYTKTFELNNTSITITILGEGGVRIDGGENLDVWVEGNTITLRDIDDFDNAWTVYYLINQAKATIRVELWKGIYDGYDPGDGSVVKLFSEVANKSRTQYHISSIEQYIICWNNLGAQVFDTNEPNKGWQDFNNFVNIPITKVISGSTETIRDKNEFTTRYKEQYIMTTESSPLLPNGSADIEVFTGSTESLKYTLNQANYYTDYKVFKSLKAPAASGYYSLSAYNKTSQKYVLAMPGRISVSISLNGGRTYTTIPYPDFEGSPYCMSLTDDGAYYCFIAKNGIYFLNLGDNTWSKDEFSANINKGLLASFKTRQIYSFLLRLDDADSTGEQIVRLYFKGYSLYAGTDPSKEWLLSYIDTVYKPNPSDGVGRLKANLNTLIDLNVKVPESNRMKIFETKNNKDENILIIAFAIPTSSVSDYLVTVIGGKNMWDAAYSTPQSNSGMLTWAEPSVNTANNFAIFDGQFITPSGDDWVYGFSFNMIVDEVSPGTYNRYYNHWKTMTWEFRLVTIPYGGDSVGYRPLLNSTNSANVLPVIDEDYYILDGIDYFATPLKLEQGIIYYNPILSEGIYFLPYDINRWEPFKALNNYADGQLIQFTASYDKYFIRTYDDTTEDNSDTRLFTNLLTTDDLVTFTYTYGEHSKYTKVPTVSYSDTELYLGFDNLLQITRNERNIEKATTISFNMPESNNQSFIENITAMINISTTEVALFFLNKIVICSKVQDTNLAQGFRYDYYNTKFSVGIRLNDTVMNTLEGQYTIFPTKRGLAIMNYQAFMATTDQVIQYITDDIRELWNSFYETNNTIKIIQWNNKLVLTNNSSTILLFDLDKSAWWKWEIPVIVKKAVTDHLQLRIIDNNLNIFKDATQYYDFSEIGNFKPIDWYIMSQPLHMSAPNYYKNMKQLVFQFAEKDDNIVTKTMNAQIKLYRKKLSVKEPETIKFQIENLRTFVKRFNYWKINEIQWALANDTDTNVPKQFELNAISIKYEIGDEVR